MLPVFKVTYEGNLYDLAEYISELKPIRNDLDKDGSGRDITTGLFYRERIAEKQTWQAKFVDLDEGQMQHIATILDPQYVTITLLDPKTGQERTAEYYASSLDHGTQMGNYFERTTTYIGASIKIIER